MPRPRRRNRGTRWLLVEWPDRTLAVVNVRSIVTRNLLPSDLTTGKLIKVLRNDADSPAKIVMSSDDRRFLEQQMASLREYTASEQRNGSNTSLSPESTINAGDDYSASASSWVADDWSTTNSEGDNVPLRPNNRYRRSSPRSYRRNTRRSPLVSGSIIPNTNTGRDEVMERLLNLETLATQLESPERSQVMMYDQQVQTDESGPTPIERFQSIRESMLDLQRSVKELHQAIVKLRPLFNMLELIKIIVRRNNGPHQIFSGAQHISTVATQPARSNQILSSTQHISTIATQPARSNQTFSGTQHISTIATQPARSNQTFSGAQHVSTVANLPSHVPFSTPIPEHNEIRSRILINNTFDDNTPIASTSTSINTEIVMKPRIVTKTSNSESTSEDVEDTMVPIGSGKTMIPKSIFNNINWSSYTMATRKLLMAVFPRKILATHSLTGKSSPAFVHKPPKLSLDPKKVGDIVLTVTKKCKVKENLVRSAITIKCADENKMHRFKKLKRESASTRSTAVDSDEDSDMDNA